jgi:transposase
MLAVEDWAEIRRLHRSEGIPIRAISRVMGVSRNTAKRALASDRPPKYERPPKGSIVDAVEPQIRELLKVYPTMPSTVIAERIGWIRSVRVLSSRVAELRPAYLPPATRPQTKPCYPCNPSADQRRTWSSAGYRRPEPAEQPDLAGTLTFRRVRHRLRVKREALSSRHFLTGWTPDT